MLFFLSNMLLSFLGAICPGPNIVCTSSNSIIYGKKAGLATATGVLAGVALWMIFLIFGLSYLLQYPKFIMIFKITSILYLIYLSINIMTTKKLDNKINPYSNRKFFTTSFIVAILNPEIAVFYSVIFANIIQKYPINQLFHLFYSACGFIAMEGMVFFSAAIYSAKISQAINKYLNVIKMASGFLILYFVVLIFLSFFK